MCRCLFDDPFSVFYTVVELVGHVRSILDPVRNFLGVFCNDSELGAILAICKVSPFLQLTSLLASFLALFL